MLDIEPVSGFMDRDNVKPHFNIKIIGKHVFIYGFYEKLDFFGFQNDRDFCF